jgi:acyl carrier protein
MTRNGDIRELLASLVGADLVEGVGDEDLIFEQGLIDSLYLIELIDLVERRFGIQVAGEELAPENFESIAAMTRYVTTKTA